MLVPVRALIWAVTVISYLWGAEWTPREQPSRVRVREVRGTTVPGEGARTSVLMLLLSETEEPFGTRASGFLLG